MIYNMGIGELLDLYRKKKLGVYELTKLYLERIDKYDGKCGLNTTSELNEKALIAARELDNKKDRDAPLFGIPVMIKDNIDVAGLHTTAGSAALADNIADTDAHVVSNLRRRGAIILGKNNMTEFANYTTQNMPGGYSSGGGQVKNAYDENMNPSGSSSGSAVAVSAGFCAAAIGTDTSFSVVGCATVNGVTGLKPPVGTLSQTGIIPISHTLDSAGALTRSLSDALLVCDCMKDGNINTANNNTPNYTPAPTRNLRIGVNVFQREIVSEKQLSMYEELQNTLRHDGADINEVCHSYYSEMTALMKYEFKHDLEQYLSKSNAKYKTLAEIVEFYERYPERMMKYGDSHLREALDEASGRLDDEQYLNALSLRAELREKLIPELSGFDAIIMTGPTSVMHFIGIPSLALRFFTADDGTPRGIILYGANERRLYEAALTIERYCPGVTAPVLK